MLHLTTCDFDSKIDSKEIPWSHSIRRQSDGQMKRGLLERRSCAMQTLKLC